MPKNAKKLQQELKKMMNYSKFRYYNANPKANFTDDCAIRAIATGMKKSWDEVFLGLNSLALEMKLVFGDERVYGKYLCLNGWQKQNQPVKANGKKYTINEFLQGFKGSAIIHAGKCHMSYVEDGCVYDIFNCEERIIGCYWIKSDTA